MKALGVFGSTGSIGENTLTIVRAYADRYCVKVLAAGTKVAALARQALEFRPDCLVIGEAKYES
ncbi:MAG: 1-deoxy-D-xylulose-5-phosphate reductoisomerase, partial [Planctomycetes bacterium]|nr:1-deoxy-D-xylulose-5-phosphate reductoisomerase [Planctomycetota bacterium]